MLHPMLSSSNILCQAALPATCESSSQAEEQTPWLVLSESDMNGLTQLLP